MLDAHACLPRSAATTAGADTEMILDAITTFKRYILPEVANRRASVRIAPSPFSAEGRAKWPFWADVDAAGGHGAVVA